jgi:hypothetical protein
LISFLGNYYVFQKIQKGEQYERVQQLPEKN